MEPWFDVRARVELLSFKGDGTPAVEIRSLDFFSRRIAVTVLSGPPQLVVGQTAIVDLRLPVISPPASPLSPYGRDDLGPGTLAAGDKLGIYDVSGGPLRGFLEIVATAPVGADLNDPLTHRGMRESPIDVPVDPDGTVGCPTCGIGFALADRWRWTGLHHRPCGQRLRLLGRENELFPVWSIVGNIVRERPHGANENRMRTGTKHFRPGTKVYCFPALWGDGYENIRVVARHRGSMRWMVIVIRSEWVTGWRTKLVYERLVVDRLSGFWDGEPTSRAYANEIVAMMTRR